MEWWRRYAICTHPTPHHIGDDVMWGWMRARNSRSKIFEMKSRLEIGLYLDGACLSREGFLRRGTTEACLKQEGKIPSVVCIRGSSVDICCHFGICLQHGERCCFKLFKYFVRFRAVRHQRMHPFISFALFCSWFSCLDSIVDFVTIFLVFLV